MLGAGAATTAALVALYLLRPQRRRIDVPYARLWGLVAREARSSAIARKLRRWESLLLQLLIASLLLLALAEPRLGLHEARRQVILVDVSASMQAKEGSQTRLEIARTAVQHLLDGISPDDETSIVVFDTEPRVLCPLTTDDAQLRAAAARIVATDAPDDVVPALRLAADVLRGAAHGRLTLVTDGSLDLSGVEALPDVELRAVNVAVPSVDDHSDNVAITGFSVRRYAANPSAYELLVEVRSYASAPRRVTLTISQEGETVEVTTLDLPARGRVQRRLSDLAGEGRRLEASIDGHDALPLDDRAYALLPEQPRTRVLLVGSGDLYTEGALLLDRAVDVERVAPASYDAKKATTHDAVVFAGWTPPQAPSVPALFLGCEPPGCPFSTRGTMEAPIVTETRKDDPILRWVALKDLNVSRSSVFALGAGDTSLASSLGRALLVSGTKNGVRTVALGFQPQRSDLPLRVAFPILLVNSLRWLTGHGVESPDDVRTGRRTRLLAAGNLELAGPEHVHVSAHDGSAELTVHHVGFYAGTDGRLVAANLADGRESSLASRPLEVGTQTLLAPSAAQRLAPRMSPWRWLAALALLLIALEWWSFHRRHTV